MNIDIPTDVRRKHNVPDGSLEIKSIWRMGDVGDDKFGVWVARSGETSGARIYPIFDVSKAELEEWERYR